MGTRTRRHAAREESRRRTARVRRERRESLARLADAEVRAFETLPDGVVAMTPEAATVLEALMAKAS